jgi:hypothetical protein
VLAGYDLVMLDRVFRGDRAAATRRGARLFGYLSLGEINTGDPLFARLDPAAVLAANPAWPATRRVDIRHPVWRALVLDRLTPELAAGGFTGLLLDTPTFPERQDPVGHRGMRDAAPSLVCAIRARHPRLSLAMNRGYDLLPDLAPSLDALLAESLITAGDAEGYRWNSETEITRQLALIARAGYRRPALPVLSLDYWPPEDEIAIRRRPPPSPRLRSCLARDIVPAIRPTGARDGHPPLSPDPLSQRHRHRRAVPAGGRRRHHHRRYRRCLRARCARGHGGGAAEPDDRAVLRRRRRAGRHAGGQD